MKVIKYKRGQIWWYSDKTEYDGHIQGGTRPIIIISNDVANEKENVLIGIPCTTADKDYIPCNIEFIMNGNKNTALGTNIRSINPSRLTDYIGTCDDELIGKIDNCIKIALGLDSFPIEIAANADLNDINKPGDYIVKDIEITTPLVESISNKSADANKKAGRKPKMTEDEKHRFLNDYENHDSSYMLKKYNLRDSKCLQQKVYLIRKEFGVKIRNR